MRNNNCILNLLKVIDILQRNSSSSKKIGEGCTRPFLGPDIISSCYNTRPISLYTKNGTIFTSSGNSIFRVEKVSCSCVTLRGLTLSNGSYIATNQLVTINPSCICVVRCYPDTSITCL